MTDNHRQVATATEELERNVKAQTKECNESKIEVNCNADPEPLPRPQITVKSFDMPSIDCDEHVEQVVIKQEADDGAFEDCSYRCEAASMAERPRCLESSKKHMAEKSHPGIENVVEKLKKNAVAALQESAPKVDDSKEKNARRQPEVVPRKLENGLKKHLLRFCENAQLAEKQEASKEPESPQKSQDARKCPAEPFDSLLNYPRDCFLNNNNDARNSNNNVKVTEEKQPLVVKEEKTSPDAYEVSQMNCANSVTPKKLRKMEATKETNASTTDNQSVKPRVIVGSKQKPTVDISGLELLSNSIEQLEQLKPEGQATVPTELEQSPAKSKLMSPQTERNNNNVDSPLGLLCALAEQRFMEEVGDKVPRKLNLDSSEEISHAGRLLLNLGRAAMPERQEKMSEKRKYAEEEDYEGAKKFKANEFEEEESYRKADDDKDAVFRMKEKARRGLEFCERYGVEGDPVLLLNNAAVANDDHYKNSDYEKTEAFEQYPTNNGAYSEKESMDDNEDSDADMYCEKMSEMTEEGIERRLSVGDHRDCHDYSNLQAKLDAKKFIARKGHIDDDADWPNMDAMELDMRVRLADIQRQYREKQRELSKLTPKKDEKKSPGRPRKKSHSSR